jgi:hypothetical protein
MTTGCPNADTWTISPRRNINNITGTKEEGVRTIALRPICESQPLAFQGQLVRIADERQTSWTRGKGDMVGGLRKPSPR